jgi:hypothetical protein
MLESRFRGKKLYLKMEKYISPPTFPISPPISTKKSDHDQVPFCQVPHRVPAGGKVDLIYRAGSWDFFEYSHGVLNGLNSDRTGEKGAMVTPIFNFECGWRHRENGWRNIFFPEDIIYTRKQFCRRSLFLNGPCFTR